MPKVSHLIHSGKKFFEYKSPSLEAMFVTITSLCLPKTGGQQRHLAFDASCVLTHAELPTALWSRNNDYIHFAREDTEAQGNYLALVFFQLLSSVYVPLGPWREKKTITGVPQVS